MELTVFIKRSNHPLANRDKTIKSFEHESLSNPEILFIDKFEDIVYQGINTDWYLVLYDNEKLDEQLLEAFQVLLKEERCKVFAFYKKDSFGKYSICPRLFRKEVKVDKRALKPEDGYIPITNVLNGFVLEHD